MGLTYHFFNHENLRSNVLVECEHAQYPKKEDNECKTQKHSSYFNQTEQPGKCIYTVDYIKEIHVVIAFVTKLPKALFCCITKCFNYETQNQVTFIKQ